MILGIGTDLCDTRRIEKVLARHPERFLQRVFTEGERRRATSRPATIAGTLAKRFAAKEACAKALGTGIRGIRWKEMEVVNLWTGQPTLRLHGDAARKLASLTPPGHVATIHVALTDELPYAQAFVVIEANAR